MRDYRQKRGEPEGVRARIERIVAQFLEVRSLNQHLLEAHEDAGELPASDQRTTIFEFLLETVRPRLVHAHSNSPIRYLERLTGSSVLGDDTTTATTYKGRAFLLCGTPSPLFRMSYETAEALGRRLRRWSEV